MDDKIFYVQLNVILNYKLLEKICIVAVALYYIWSVINLESKVGQ